MLHSVTSNRERQEDEITVLSSIYNEKEFFYTMDKQIRCTFNVFPNFPNKLEVKFADYSPSATASIDLCDEISVDYLPPIRFYVRLPDTYPSQEPPNFWLSVIWLPPWEISFVCQKLDEMWREYRDNEILFLWLNFLQTDFFNFLNIQDSLDVSFLRTIHSTPYDYVQSRLASLCDSRAINGALFLDPIMLLTSYNKIEHKTQFNENFHTCPICLEEYIGLKCIELKNCKHICCRNCIQEHIRIRIVESVYTVLCPTLNCNYEIDVNDVKTLCPNLFSQYEELMLKKALDTMSDVIYCPKISCQYPIIRDMDEISMICPKCNYCFCTYCRKVYHGVAPCDMAPDDIEKLINDYENSNKKSKKLLEKKYGRQQMRLIEKHLTTEYLKDNAKSCPKCHSLISKIDGCNKMTCSHCQSHFCWLCGHEITSIDAYEHFVRDDSPCYGRLFKGAEDIDYDIMQNMILFEPDFYFA